MLDLFNANGQLKTPKQIMSRVLSQLKADNANKRVKYRQSILDRYTGDDISGPLNSYFSENARSLAKVAEQNIIKQIVDNEAQVYSEMPVVSFPQDDPVEGEAVEGEAVEGEASAADVEEVKLPDEYDQVKRWMMFQKAEIRTRLLGTGLINIFWNDDLNGDKGAIDWKYIYNYQIATGDDPLTPIAIMYPLQQHIADANKTGDNNDGPQVWMFWSKDKHFKFTWEGSVMIPTDKNDKMINPYGVLPFVSVHPDFQDGEYWVTSPQVDTVNVMDSVNKGETEGRLGIRFAMGQRVVKGEMDNTFIDLGIDYLVNVPTDGAYEHVTPGSDFTGIIDMLKFQLRIMLHNHGQAAEFTEESTSPASGFSLTVRNRPLARLWKKARNLWRWYDKDAYALEQIISAKHSGPKLPDGRHLDYAEPEMPRTIDEEITAEDHDLELGLTNLAVLAMKRDPDAYNNEDEASEAIKNNKELNASLGYKSATAPTENRNFKLPGVVTPPPTGDESQ